MTQPAAATDQFYLPYGDLEEVIADLIGTNAEAVRIRFRKLRLRPFPDDIRSGTGVRVHYNLRRTLALIAASQLNNLFIPQGSATAIVESTWPEWCRALLAAAASSSLIEPPDGMPSIAGPIVEIGGGAMAVNPAWLDVSAVRQADSSKLSIRPSIIVDTGQIVSILTAWADQKSPAMREALRSDLAALEWDFGWRRPQISDAYLSDLPRGTSFLDEGPYFDRALHFLNADPKHFDAGENPGARLRLETIYKYLAHPAPLDAYKREIGHAGSTSSLWHLLHFHACDLGLETDEHIPEICNSLDPRGDALRLIQAALAPRTKSPGRP